MNLWPYAFFAIASAFSGWGWWRSRVRATEIRRIAELDRFHYLSEVLPRSLSLRDLPLSPIPSGWNAIDCERRGKRAVAFDCRFGEANESWSRTVIAVQADRADIPASSYDPDVQTDQIADWAFIYGHSRVTLNEKVVKTVQTHAYRNKRMPPLKAEIK